MQCAFVRIPTNSRCTTTFEAEHEASAGRLIWWPQDVPAPLQAEGLLYCGSAAPVEQAFSLHWPMLSQRAIVTGFRPALWLLRGILRGAREAL